jgi:putative transposase
MIVKKSYKFRLLPTKKQIAALLYVLEECRFLYNQCLDQRKLAYEELGLSLSKYDQLMLLPLLKEERTSLCKVHSQILQDVIARLDKAFDNFFRRCKEGSDEPGFPRFRGAFRYDSFTYPQSGFSVVGNELKLSKIGSIRIKLHRPISGKIKTCSLKCDASGAWYVTLSCEVESCSLPTSTQSVGIDMGIENWAYLSNGTVIQNPRFFKKEEKALAKSQRKLSLLEKGTTARHKQRKVVAKIHERVRNKRSDFCHKVSRTIVNTYQYICVEELEVQKMVKGSPLGHQMSKSIADASWEQFCRFLSYKAEDAGRKIGFVNPAYTSQDCSKCGNRERKKLSQREHCCSQCGYTAHRDRNAAENILALGLDGLGICPRSFCL